MLSYRNRSFSLLDCTLRDGGYYNSWDFESSLVDAYLAAMNASSVDIVEVGFRFFDNESYKGAFAYCRDSYLEQMETLPDKKLAVMINAADLFDGSKVDLFRLGVLFPVRKSESRIDIVRIACRKHEVMQLSQVISELENLGYEVILNLMQIADCSDSELALIVRFVDDSGASVFYFADSTGSLLPKDVNEKIKKIFECGLSLPLGVHLHDNLGLALANAISAIESGATYIDATMLGMGRGPGNVKTEEALMLWGSVSGCTSEPVVDCVQQYFLPLKRRFEWGSNPLYFYSGKESIHPTYAQHLIAKSVDVKYSEALRTLSDLPPELSSKFTGDFMEKSVSSDESIGGDIASTIDQLCLREAVIFVANSASVQKCLPAIKQIALTQSVSIVALNELPRDWDIPIQALLLVHPMRKVSLSVINPSIAQVVIPNDSLLKDSLDTQQDVIYYSVSLRDGHLDATADSCVIPSLNVLAYGLAIASRKNVKQIFLAGIDGFQDKEKNNEIYSLLNIYHSRLDRPKLISLTPTVYPISTKSPFGHIVI